MHAAPAVLFWLRRRADVLDDGAVDDVFEGGLGGFGGGGGGGVAGRGFGDEGLQDGLLVGLSVWLVYEKGRGSW